MAVIEEFSEVIDLLHTVESWSEEEIEQLPKLYRDKAYEIREIAQELNLD